MTDEELEKKAEKYFKNIGKECGYDKEFEETGKRHYWIGLDIKKAYIAGAKENGLQWHDLRKNSKDLPEYHKVVLISFYSYQENKLTTTYCCYCKDQGWTDPEDNEPYPYLNKDGVVIAWCELPKFEE